MRHLALVLVGLAFVSAATAQAADALVTIDNFTFAPDRVTIEAGTRVVWLNRDDIPHTIVDAADPKGARSPPLDTAESYTRVFPTPGTYRYFCSLHPHMQGTVVVR